MPNRDQIKQALNAAVRKPKYTGRKTQMSESAFSTLVAHVKVELEILDYGELGKADEKTLAELVAADKVSFLAVNGKIGTYDAAAAQSTPAITGSPRYTNLNQQF